MCESSLTSPVAPQPTITAERSTNVGAWAPPRPARTIQTVGSPLGARSSSGSSPPMSASQLANPGRAARRKARSMGPSTVSRTWLPSSVIIIADARGCSSNPALPRFVTAHLTRFSIKVMPERFRSDRVSASKPSWSDTRSTTAVTSWSWPSAIDRRTSPNSRSTDGRRDFTPSASLLGSRPPPSETAIRAGYVASGLGACWQRQRACERQAIAPKLMPNASTTRTAKPCPFQPVLLGQCKREGVCRRRSLLLRNVRRTLPWTVADSLLPTQEPVLLTTVHSHPLVRYRVQAIAPPRARTHVGGRVLMGQAAFAWATVGRGPRLLAL